MGNDQFLPINSLDKRQKERRRGWIVRFLYESRPTPLEVSLLQEVMDAQNFPMSCRQLVQELDFLRSEQLLRVFPHGSEIELSDVQQARLLQRCCEIEEEAKNVSVRIRTQGVNFQEGSIGCLGVARIS